MVVVEDRYSTKVQDEELHMENAILFTVRDELNLDHYFIPERNVLLIRINHGTLENEMLRDDGRK